MEYNVIAGAVGAAIGAVTAWLIQSARARARIAAAEARLGVLGTRTPSRAPRPICSGFHLSLIAQRTADC